MWRQFYAGLHEPWLPLFGMAVFVSGFLLVLLRTYGFKRRADFDAVASLALNDDGLSKRGERS